MKDTKRELEVSKLTKFIKDRRNRTKELISNLRKTIKSQEIHYNLQCDFNDENDNKNSGLEFNMYYDVRY